MALTSTEEALVRQLLDQQAAILSLAENEATITSKLGATKVTLSDLVSASSVGDTDLFLTRQGTTDKNVTAQILKAALQSFTQEGTGAIARSVNDKFKEQVSVKDFGAVGDGVTNDTDAFAAASAYITAQDGGKLIVPRGTYIVGKQTFAGASGLGYAYRPSNIIKIENCTKPVAIEFQGAVLKLAPGLKFGSFNPVTGAPHYPTLPFYDQNYGADVGVMVSLQNNSNVSVFGACEMDGNIQNIVLGGQWGDRGYQRLGYGINAYGNNNLYVENLYAHHHAADGVVVGYTGLTEVSETKPTTLINVVSEYNARQGFSIVGANSMTMIGCRGNNTGRSTFASALGAGINFEAESSVVRNFSLIDCEFVNNIGVGVVADSGDVSGITFLRCKAIGTTAYTIWTRKPRIVFHDCFFAGSVVNPYSSTTNPDEATKFYNCKFTDELSYSPTGTLYNQTYLIHNDTVPNVLYDGCTIIATRSKAGFIRGAILKDVTVIVKAGTDFIADHDTVLDLQGTSFTNLTILDQIVSNIPTDGYAVYLPGGFQSWRGVNYINSPSGKIKWFSWSPGAGGASGYLGQNNPESYPFTGLCIGKGQGSELIGYFGKIKIVAGSAAPTSGTWGVGDRCINSNPVAGQPKGWACTVAGTPGTWVSEGNL